MKCFTTTRTKRSTAWLMFTVWIFALASGIANACALEARGTRDQSMAVGIHHEIASLAPSADDASADSQHDRDSHDSKSPCRKACDDGSLSLLKHSVGSDLIDPGSALVMTLAWTVAATVLSARARAQDLWPPSSGLPLRIRYMRLAL